MGLSLATSGAARPLQGTHGLRLAAVRLAHLQQCVPATERETSENHLDPQPRVKVSEVPTCARYTPLPGSPRRLRARTT